MIVTAIQEISQGPTSETPALLFARKGDRLLIIREGSRLPAYPEKRLEMLNLTMKGWPTFWVNRGEFE